MAEYKDFTLGEVLTIITGVCYSKTDPLATNLIHWISGEPASEYTWKMESPNRIDYCRVWLLKSVGNIVIASTDSCIKEIVKSDHIEPKNMEWLGLETEKVSVRKPYDFPSPPIKIIDYY